MWRLNGEQRWLSHFSVKISVIPFLLFTAKAQYLLWLNFSFRRWGVFRGFSGSLKYTQSRNLWLFSSIPFFKHMRRHKGSFSHRKSSDRFQFSKASLIQHLSFIYGFHKVLSVWDYCFFYIKSRSPGCRFDCKYGEVVIFTLNKMHKQNWKCNFICDVSPPFATVINCTSFVMISIFHPKLLCSDFCILFF